MYRPDLENIRQQATSEEMLLTLCIYNPLPLQHHHQSRLLQIGLSATTATGLCHSSRRLLQLQMAIVCCTLWHQGMPHGNICSSMKRHTYIIFCSVLSLSTCYRECSLCRGVLGRLLADRSLKLNQFKWQEQLTQFWRRQKEHLRS